MLLKWDRFHPNLQELRLSGQFTDGILESSDGVQFKIHKIILGGLSEYFRAVFTIPLPKPSSEVVRLNIDSETLSSIIDYSYTGGCGISWSNVERLLPAADELGILSLVRKCSEFLLEHLTPCNCWGIYRFATSYFCTKLADAAFKYTLDNFDSVCEQSPELVDIELSDLVKLLSNIYLNVSHEDKVVWAIDKWIQHEVNSRSQCATMLYSNVRFGFVSKDTYRKYLLHSPYVKQISDEFLMDVDEILGKCLTGGVTDLDSSLCWPRVPFSIVFSIGGWSGNSATNLIETYDSKANRWLVLTDYEDRVRAYHGLVSVNNVLYMIGGYDGVTYYNTMRKFDPATGKWSSLACMHSNRCYVACAVVGRCIYAIGGYNGRSRVNSVEKYSIDQDEWTLVSPMMYRRSDASAAAHNGKVYVVGGFSGTQILTTAEVFCPESNQWSVLPELSRPRSGVSVVVFRDELYALGGFDGVSRLSSVEKLNLKDPDQVWDQNIPPMLTQRSNFACVVVNDSIVVIGGYNADRSDNVPVSSQTTANVEQYRPESGGWSALCPLACNRSALTACVLSGLPNGARYSFARLVSAASAMGNERPPGGYFDVGRRGSGEPLELMTTAENNITG